VVDAADRPVGYFSARDVARTEHLDAGRIDADRRRYEMTEPPADDETEEGMVDEAIFHVRAATRDHSPRRERRRRLRGEQTFLDGAARLPRRKIARDVEPALRGRLLRAVYRAGRTRFAPQESNCGGAEPRRRVEPRRPNRTAGERSLDHHAPVFSERRHGPLERLAVRTWRTRGADDEPLGAQTAGEVAQPAGSALGLPSVRQHEARR
jgi:hypothetical protein